MPELVLALISICIALPGAALPHLTADDLPARLVRDIQVRTIRAAADGAPVSAWLNGLADNIEAGSA